MYCRYFNEITKKEIETLFYPYTITVCTIDEFYLENYWENTIRCVVINDKIDKLQVN